MKWLQKEYKWPGAFAQIDTYKTRNLARQLLSKASKLINAIKFSRISERSEPLAINIGNSLKLIYGGIQIVRTANFRDF